MKELREALEELGASLEIHDFVAALGAQRNVRCWDGESASYVGLVPATDSQVAIFAHRGHLSIALDPEDVRRVGESSGLRQEAGGTETAYLHASSAHLLDPRIRTVVLDACTRALDRSLLRPSRPIPRRRTNSAAATRPVCPTHFIEIPLSGLCTQCEEARQYGGAPVLGPGTSLASCRGLPVRG
jgi:hypothetical protein